MSFFTALSSIGFGLPPFLPLLIGSVLVACTQGKLQKGLLVLTPIIGFINLLSVSSGAGYHYSLMGLDLILVQSDKLAMLFGYLFHLAAFIGVIYALKVNDRIQHVAALAYAANAIGAVFAGDWITLFLFWEGLALTSVFLIWARRTERSYKSGIRYLIFQVLSGVLLFAGALLLIDGGMPAKIQALDIHLAWPNTSTALGIWLIFLSFGIKCGFPLLHTWITDAYPEATESGAVFLAAFTTKVAVYALARCFAGTEMLVPIGLTMACFPIFYAVIENDLRRVLTYSMINQIGFMVCGIGIGTELAINGTVAHAFNDVLFKGLLMMSMGAVLLRTGNINGSDLGGLYKTMPKTTILCIIGAASISAFPLFNGFVSKAIIMAEMLHHGHTIGWMLLLFAAAGVFHHAGIKIPFFAFFAHDSGRRVKEAPTNMLIAMTIGAAFCIGIGSFPHYFYQLLPYEMNYSPYDLTHVLTQLQLLFFSALAFVFLNMKGLYPPELRSSNLDSDWLYRRLFPAMYKAFAGWVIMTQKSTMQVMTSFLSNSVNWVAKFSQPGGILARGWGINNMIFIIVLLLGTLLFFNF